MGSITDIHLPAFKADDEGANDVIWSRYVHRFLMLTKRKLDDHHIPGSECEADDIWNEVFERLCEQRDQNGLQRISRQSDLYSWLLVTVTRRVIDVKRRVARRSMVRTASQLWTDADDSTSLEQLAVDYANDVAADVTFEELLSQIPSDLRPYVEKIAWNTKKTSTELSAGTVKALADKIDSSIALLLLFVETRGGRIRPTINHSLRKLRKKLPRKEMACFSMTLQGLSRLAIARHLKADPVQVDMWLDQVNQKICKIRFHG